MAKQNGGARKKFSIFTFGTVWPFHTPSYLFDTAIQDGIECILWQFVTAQDLCCNEIKKHLPTPLAALYWIEQW